MNLSEKEKDVKIDIDDDDREEYGKYTSFYYEKDVKQFIKMLLLHTETKTIKNDYVDQWKDSMTDTIKRLAGDKLIK